MVERNGVSGGLNVWRRGYRHDSRRDGGATPLHKILSWV